MKKKSFLLFLVIILFSVFAAAAFEQMDWTVTAEGIKGEPCFEQLLPKAWQRRDDMHYFTVEGTYSYVIPEDATSIELHNWYYWKERSIGPSTFSINDGSPIYFFKGRAVILKEGHVCEKVSKHGWKCMYPYDADDSGYNAENIGGSTVTIDTGSTSGYDHALMIDIVLKAYCGDVSASGSADVADGSAQNINADLSALDPISVGEGNCVGWYNLCNSGSYTEVQRLSCEEGSVVKELVGYKDTKVIVTGTQLLGVSMNDGECINNRNSRSNAICSGSGGDCGTLDGSANVLTCPEGYGMRRLLSYKNSANSLPITYSAMCASFNDYSQREVASCSGWPCSKPPSLIGPQSIYCPDGYFISEIISAKSSAGVVYPIDAVCRSLDKEITLSYTGNVMAWFFGTNSLISTYPDNIIACVDLDLNNICDYLEVPEAVCGDGTINVAGEECDGADLGGKDCTDFVDSVTGSEFTGGRLGCSSGCNFDTSQCSSEILPLCPIDTSLCADGYCRSICGVIPCDDGSDGFCVIGCTPDDPDCGGCDPTDLGCVPPTCSPGDGCAGGTCSTPDPDCDGATCNEGDKCLFGCTPVDPDCCYHDSDCCPDFSNTDCDLCSGGNTCAVGCPVLDPDCGGGTCDQGDGCGGGACITIVNPDGDPDCDGATCSGGDVCLNCDPPDPDCFYSCNDNEICDSNEGCDCSDCDLEPDSCGLDNGEQLYCNPDNNLCGSLPCRFDSVEWEDLCAKERQRVGAILFANSGCLDKQVDFSVSEIDLLGNDPAETNPDPSDVILSSDLGTGYIAFAVWTAEHSDVTFPSKYSIEAILNEDSNVNVVSDELLEVYGETYECEGCSLSVTIGSGQSCVDGVCWEGDKIKVNANYNGQDCPEGETFLQADLEDDDTGECSFQLNTTCTSSGNCESVELDYELIEDYELCFGEIIIGAEARLYSDSSYSDSSFIEFSDVGGSFEFGSGAYDCEEDIGGWCLSDSEVVGGLDCAVTIPTTGCDNGKKCYTDCGDSCGDAGGQWCSLTGYGDFYGDEEFSDYISGSGCWNDCVLKNCGNAWSVGVWSECSKDGFKERDVWGPNFGEAVGFVNAGEYYKYCGDYKPNDTIECIIEAPFPFFSWFNILLSILILISYYFWKERKNCFKN